MFGTTTAIFSILLVVTGAAKTVSPHSTSKAIRAMGVPVPLWFGRLLGLGEIGVGGFAAGLGLPFLLVLQGSLYAAFLAWIVAAIVRDVPVESCGCLGTADTPPYWGHAIVNTIAMVVSFMAAFAAEVSMFEGELMAVVTNVVVASVGAYLGWVVIGDGARLHGALSR